MQYVISEIMIPCRLRSSTFNFRRCLSKVEVECGQAGLSGLEGGACGGFAPPGSKPCEWGCHFGELGGAVCGGEGDGQIVSSISVALLPKHNSFDLWECSPFLAGRHVHSRQPPGGLVCQGHVPEPIQPQAGHQLAHITLP